MIVMCLLHRDDTLMDYSEMWHVKPDLSSVPANFILLSIYYDCVR